MQLSIMVRKVRKVVAVVALPLLLACTSDLDRSHTAALEAHARVEADSTPANLRAFRRAAGAYCALVEREAKRAESWERVMEEVGRACGPPISCDLGWCEDLRGVDAEPHHDDHD